MSKVPIGARPAVALALACAGCTAPAFEGFTSANYPPEDPPATTTTAASSDASPTTGVMLTSGDEPGSTSSTTGLDTTGVDTTGVDTTSGTTEQPAGPPSILDIALVPDPLHISGVIEVTVTADDADDVTMQVDGGAPQHLEVVGPGQFIGSIAFYSAAANGPHTAVFVPLRDGDAGTEAKRDFLVDLPAAGSEIFWEAIDLLGKGYVAAVATTPDGDVVEFGTLTTAPSRCYLRRRTRQGAWGPDDVHILSETPCAATDLGVAPDGTLYLLADRSGAGDLSWWLARVDSFGEAPQNLRLGNKGETAAALAMDDDRLAVCGTEPTEASDLDLMVNIVGFDQSGFTRDFDYRPPNVPSHKFTERPRDCVFAGSKLVIGGVVSGKIKPNEPNAPVLDRRLLVEFAPDTDAILWTVDTTPADTAQSGIESLTVDDTNHYITGGYTCGYPCADQQAELRVFAAGGTETWQMDLSPTLAAPQDLAWSPAGYVVFTSAQQLGPWSSAFFVQAWVPGTYPAQWSYDHNVEPTLHMANAIAIGEFGQIYTGGIGATGYPAIAFING